MRNMKIALTGFGNANKPLVELFVSERQRIAGMGITLTIVGAADSKGAVVAPEGIAPEELLRIRAEAGTVSAAAGVGKPGMLAMEMIETCGADLLVECLPPFLPTGEPGFSHMMRALELGMHVVTANKAPLALYWDRLFALAEKQGKRIRYGSAASAGLPTIELGRFLGKTGELLDFAGIFNATSQYILEGMAEGKSYEESMRGAQEGGFADPDPTSDVEGWDSAMKTVIQANAYWGGGFHLNDVERTGITGLTKEDVLKAQSENKVWCLVGRASVEPTKKISVAPECLPVDHPIARVRWCDKMVYMRTRSLGDQVHYCLGASASGTPGNMFDDILDIALDQ